MGAQKYFVLDNLNAGQHLPGDVVELSEAEAAPLLVLRVIIQVPPEPPAALLPDEDQSVEVPPVEQPPEDADDTKTLSVERFEPGDGKTDSADQAQAAAPAKSKRAAPA